jgi:Mg2+-importing ATPase
MLDLAVIKKAEELDIDDPVLGFEKIDEIPFDFQRKRMSVIVVDKQKKQQLITKGAYEEIMNICNYAKYKGKIVRITKAIRDKASNIVKQLNSDGMRVIAIAINYENLPKRNFQIKDENNLILIGFIALLDPPKKTAYSAINALQKNGIKVKVLTGDNEIVTKYVCSKVGIDSSNILLGSDISRMSDSELKNKVMKVNVFAKLSPEQKQRIVLAIKDNNRVVGFMGDGINDASAMKAADIGISVDTAVDIAKESADIILLEKDLRILEKGVIEGRKAFCNIIKYIKMSVSSSFGNMLSMLIGSC